MVWSNLSSLVSTGRLSFSQLMTGSGRPWIWHWNLATPDSSACTDSGWTWKSAMAVEGGRGGFQVKTQLQSDEPGCWQYYHMTKYGALSFQVNDVLYHVVIMSASVNYNFTTTLRVVNLLRQRWKYWLTEDNQCGTAVLRTQALSYKCGNSSIAALFTHHNEREISLYRVLNMSRTILTAVKLLWKTWFSSNCFNNSLSLSLCICTHTHTHTHTRFYIMTQVIKWRTCTYWRTVKDSHYLWRRKLY